MFNVKAPWYCITALGVTLWTPTTSAVLYIYLWPWRDLYRLVELLSTLPRTTTTTKARLSSDQRLLQLSKPSWLVVRWSRNDEHKDSGIWTGSVRMSYCAVATNRGLFIKTNCSGKDQWGFSCSSQNIFAWNVWTACQRLG